MPSTISVKSIIIGLLSFLGMMAILLSVLSSQQYTHQAIQQQHTTVEQFVSVLSRQSLEGLTQTVKTLGSELKKNKALRKLGKQGRIPKK